MLNYLVCCTPRTGSNLLCGLLIRSQVAGRPQEYFCPSFMAEHGPELCGMSEAQSGEEFQLLLDALREKESSNDRFGAKAHLHQLRSVLSLGYDLKANLPNRFIYLTRADQVGRAISSVKALQTGAWISKTEKKGELRFDPALIQREIQRTVQENAEWEALFRELRVEPYRISYETLCADPEAEFASILEFLDIDPFTVDVANCIESANRYFKPQRDEVSESWRRGYRLWLRQQAADRCPVPARA